MENGTHKNTYDITPYIFAWHNQYSSSLYAVSDYKNVDYIFVKRTKKKLACQPWKILDFNRRTCVFGQILGVSQK
jgi:hypothetical protein